MPTHRVAFVLLAVSLSLAACSSQRTPASQLAVFTSQDDVPEGAVVLGEVDPVDRGSRSRYGAVNSELDRAKRRASALGADAILIMERDAEVSDVRIRNALSAEASSASRYRYVALRLPGAEADGGGL